MSHNFPKNEYRVLEVFEMKPAQAVERSHRFSTRDHRRRGFVTLYLALSLTLLLGISSLVIDLGVAFQKRSYMQKASDASALAGAAYAVQNPLATIAQVKSAAENFATTNYGYTNGSNNVTVTTTVTPVSSGTGSIAVSILRPQPTLFARIFSLSMFGGTPMRIDAMQIGASAMATYTTLGTVKTPISGNSTGYGLVDQATANLSLLGPLATTNRGDNRSARYTSSNGANNGPSISVNNGGTDQIGGSQIGYTPAVLRPKGDDRTKYQASFSAGENFPVGDGYYFDLAMPTGGGKALLQIYDPGTADQKSDPNAYKGKAWNETADGTNSTRRFDGTMSAVPTKTLFQVWSDNGTPDDISDDVQIGAQLYGNESAYSQKWVNSFLIEPSKYPATANYYLNATTVDGNGKNGFDIRLNRTDDGVTAKDTDTTFKTGGNGSGVTTRGILPINFGSDGDAVLALGNVKAGATTMIVTRFDVDVGTDGGGFFLTYTDSNGLTYTPPVKGLGGGNANDKYQTDIIPLGSSYAGGDWKVSYKAGTNDQSTWKMSYTGVPENPTTSIRLVD